LASHLGSWVVFLSMSCQEGELPMRPDRLKTAAPETPLPDFVPQQAPVMTGLCITTDVTISLRRIEDLSVSVIVQFK
jgi:hypothetical protein